MKKIQKISVLTVSLLTIMSTASIAPVLSSIYEHFEGVSFLQVKLVLTLPAIFTFVTTLLIGPLLPIVSRKSIVLTGLLFFMVGGLGGFFATSLVMLLILRAIMGIGVGMLIPLSTVLIADFFSGEERSKMMGFSTSFNNLGGIIGTLIAGYLASFGWNYPFLVYLMGFITFFMVILYLPKQEIRTTKKVKQKLNQNIILLAFSNIMVMLIFYSIPSGLSFYASSINLASDSMIGVLLSLTTLSSFLTGLIYSKIRNVLKTFTGISGVLILSSGMLLVGVSSTLIPITMAMALIGVGLGILIPNIYLMTSRLASMNSIPLSLSIVSGFLFMGQFLTPIMIKFLQDVFSYENVESPFVISFFIGMFAVIALVVNRRVKFYDENRIHY